jgi:hypothetical protein
LCAGNKEEGKEKKMSLSDRKAGKLWTSSEVKQLRELARQNTPTRVIALKIGHPEGGVRAKASEKNISLKPTNQSPYNRR